MSCVAPWWSNNAGTLAGGLTAKQTKDIERVQKRCLKLIYPTLSYSEALLLSGLEELGIRRERITKELF